MSNQWPPPLQGNGPYGQQTPQDRLDWPSRAADAVAPDWKVDALDIGGSGTRQL